MKMKAVWSNNDGMLSSNVHQIDYQTNAGLDVNFITPDVFNNEASIQKKTQAIGQHLLSDLVSSDTKKRDGRGCYRIKNGYFLDTEILITILNCQLHVVFLAAQIEQAYVLRNEIPRMKEKLAHGVQDCIIEVIFENRRL